MALRASATVRPPLPLPPSSPSPPPRTLSFSKYAPKAQLKPSSISLPTSTTLSLFALFTAPNEAKALSLSKEQIVSSLTQVEKTIDQAQELGSSFFDVVQRVFQVVAESMKPGIEVAMPILNQAGDQAVKIASPAVSEASKKALEAIESSGFDTEPVLSAAKTFADAAQQTTKVIEGAKPMVSSTVETISSADPVSIVAAGGALFLAYFLLPPIWSVVSFSLRGYKGELTPAQTLDLVSTRNHVLIDIRAEKDKNKAGIPRLPSSAKNKMIAIPYSDSAKIVARTLTSLGFSNCWVVADGFSGRRGWLQSRLGADSYNVSIAEVLSPSRVIPAVVQRFGTTGSAKLLPGGFE
ncbi:calcium sensing receptor [Actinidia rufa]|uniref:Calcium sensing receptor n=1 Tax=Actinidia rufa TaxID=165716 RepID=A0A7J0GN01_9ERIC|nr:calcium sensing receptor [Actinidia rufa]